MQNDERRKSALGISVSSRGALARGSFERRTPFGITDVRGLKAAAEKEQTQKTNCHRQRPTDRYEK
jgi:hypothetical protein